MVTKPTVELGKCPPSLGTKAAGLSTMLALGLAVPPGFVIPNPAGMTAASLGAAVKKLGSKTKPLLLAVRPSVNGQARGYMEAILNVGLNDETVETLAARLNDQSLVSRKTACSPKMLAMPCSSSRRRAAAMPAMRAEASSVPRSRAKR